jgi:hypothetical protein
MKQMRRIRRPVALSVGLCAPRRRPGRDDPGRLGGGALGRSAFGAPADFRRRADEERRRSGLPVARATLAALDAVAAELSAKAGFGGLPTAWS